MKKIIIIITLFFLSHNIYSQNIDHRYLSIITYLKTNKEINDKIKEVFKKLTKKRDKYVEFNLSKRIDFLGIDAFNNMLSFKKHEIHQPYLNDNSLYYKQYYFESYEYSLLEKIIKPNSSELFLTFSKPIDNHLIIEIGYMNPKVYKEVKFGLVLQVFFTFDNSGLVEGVLYSRIAYN